MPSFGGASLALSAAGHSIAHSRNKTLMIIYIVIGSIACFGMTCALICSICERKKKKPSTSTTSSPRPPPPPITSPQSSATNNPLYYNPLYMETSTQKYERECRERREKRGEKRGERKDKVKRTMGSTESTASSPSSNNAQGDGMTQMQTQTKGGQQENNWSNWSYHGGGMTEVPPPPVYESVYKNSRIGSGSKVQDEEEEIPSYKPRVRRGDGHL